MTQQAKKEWLMAIAKKCNKEYEKPKMYQRNSNKAFENAKKKGLNKPSEYMYMYSQDNKDYFKNINFRNYINFVQ